MQTITTKPRRCSENGGNQTSIIPQKIRKQAFLFAILGTIAWLSPKIAVPAQPNTRSAPTVRKHRTDDSEPASPALLRERARSQTRVFSVLPDALLTELKRQDAADAAHRLRIGF